MKFLIFTVLWIVSYPLMAIGWLIAFIPAVLGFLPTKLHEWAEANRDRHRPSSKGGRNRLPGQPNWMIDSRE